ncbi:zinc knuckle [Paraphaeosphaeria minitans]|uniref:Zinc knuckle n=1 Tax=Paraphaeosphaeria minitans TaxID=565426 RepID=A0A9P6KJ90_9PLEO|nr:zinc knuckle [Paraphaeosphaeria minitans]
MLWTHRDITARPIPTESTDIAALLIELETGPLLAISVYIPAKSDSEDRELNSRLDIIRRTIDTTRRNHDRRVELLIAGDFNRHDQFWGGDVVATSQRQGEGEPIIQLMSELDLQCPLPRGIETWVSYSGEHSSTIDLILVTQELASELQRCTTDSTAHGSDHLAICTEFAIDLTHEKGTPRKLWKKARWDPIRKVVAGELERRSQPDIPGDVDSYCQFITECIAPAIEKHVPVARPSPYAKRWWTEDLTELRKHYTYWRNKASASRRANTPDPGLQQMAVTYRKRYHDAIRNQRKTHWQDFVAEARNVWTMARYLDPAQCATFARIPAIETNEGVSTSSGEIARCLLEEFFKPPPGVTEEPEDERPREALPMEPLSEVEVQRAIFASNPYKAPGRDGLPAIVWQQLWPVLKHHIVALFKLSLETATLPSEWRVAKIVPLRKPNKPDYTVAKAYRPISLLASLGKGLEAVVAERLSFLAETHRLLPKSHFGARKGRSTTQALTILQESIFQACRDKRVLSLVSLDVKGAYNGVNIDVLTKRLRKRGIPNVLVDWITCFCSQRKASVVVNGHTTKKVDLP